MVIGTKRPVGRPRMERLTVPTEKRCSKCGETKTITEFGPGGLNGYCHPCRAAYFREYRWRKARGAALAMREQGQKHPKEWVLLTAKRPEDTATNPMHRYAYPAQHPATWTERGTLTPQQYDRLWNVQRGVCGLCRQEEQRAAVPSGRITGRLGTVAARHGRALAQVNGLLNTFTLLCPACVELVFRSLHLSGQGIKTASPGVQDEAARAYVQAYQRIVVELQREGRWQPFQATIAMHRMACEAKRLSIEDFTTTSEPADEATLLRWIREDRAAEAV